MLVTETSNAQTYCRMYGMAYFICAICRSIIAMQLPICTTLLSVNFTALDLCEKEVLMMDELPIDFMAARQ